MPSIRKQPNDYKRTILSPETGYVRAMTTQLQTQYPGATQEQLDRFFKEVVMPKKRVPTVKFFYRGANGDKSKKTLPLDEYLSKIQGSDMLCAPTLTTYKPKSVEVSKVTGMVTEGAAARIAYKKQKFDAETRGDTRTAAFGQVMQVACKTIQNSVSGSADSPGSILNNPSLHTSLTSTARIATSISNITVERAISGLRQYRNLNVAWSNVIYTQNVATDIGENKILDVMEKYKLHIPTVADCSTMIYDNTKVYIRNPDMTLITDYLNKVSIATRCLLLYMGDLHHLLKHNEDFFRLFYATLLEKIQGDVIPNAAERFGKMPDDLKGYIHHRFSGDCRGMGTIYKSMPEQLISDMYRTALNVNKVHESYIDLLHLLFRTPLVSPEVGYYRSMVRDSVLINDTDSGIFTTQDFVVWYRQGKPLLGEESMAVAGLTGYLGVQAVDHQLRQLSANLGVAEDDIDIINMKSEITFQLLSLTAKAKHYWGDKAIIERNVMDKVILETKGVELKNASRPTIVKALAEEMETSLVNDLVGNKGIDPIAYLQKVLDLERRIHDEIHAGNYEYTSSIDINPADSYKIKDVWKNNAIWYKFWQMTYGRAYKHPIPEVYKAVILKTTLVGKKRLENWVDSMDNELLQRGMRQFLEKSGRTNMDVIRIPETYLVQHGLPKDLVPHIATEQLITAQCGMLYMILEGIGLYKEPKMTWSAYISTGRRDIDSLSLENRKHELGVN